MLVLFDRRWNHKGKEPMDISYRTELPSEEDMWTLFASTGWNREYRLSSRELITALSRSWYVVSAYDGLRFIGTGRIVSDGILHAMIYDLIVDPEYQRHGIGSDILQRLILAARDAGIRDIQLFCAQGKSGFYTKHGFRARPEGAPGMEYVPPRRRRTRGNPAPGTL